MSKTKTLTQKILKKSSPEEQEAEQKLLAVRVNNFQSEGTTDKVKEPLNKALYTTFKKEYGELISKKLIKAEPQLSFDLNKYQAIIAFRAKKDTSEYLKNCNALTSKNTISTSRDTFIIELHRELEKMQKEALVDNVDNIYKYLYHPLIKHVFNTVGSYLKDSKYEAALKEIDTLLNKCITPRILEKYVDIRLQEGDMVKIVECWDFCTKVDNNKKDIFLSKLFEKLQDKFKKASEEAATDKLKVQYKTVSEEAGNRAKHHTPEIEKKPDTISREARLLEQKLIETQEELKKVQTKLVTTETQAAKLAIKEQLQAEYMTKIAELEADIKAQENRHETKLAYELDRQLKAIQNQTSPTIVKATAPEPTSTSDDLPSYEDSLAKVVNSKYLKIADSNSNATGNRLTITDDENNEVTTTSKTSDTAIIVSPSAQIEIDEITSILYSEKPNMERVVVLWKKAIEKNNDIYNLVDDIKLLMNLASNLASNHLVSDKCTIKAICDKVVNKLNLKTAYNDTKSPEVLNLLAETYHEGGWEQECINSCVKSYKENKSPYLKNYQLLKEIGDKTTDNNLAMEALGAAMNQAPTDKQKADIYISQAKLYSSLGNHHAVKQFYCAAIRYEPNIYKDVDDKTLMSLSEAIHGHNDKLQLQYLCLSKLSKNKPGDSNIANKLIALGESMTVSYPLEQIVCFIDAYLSSHDPSLLPKIKDDLSGIVKKGAGCSAACQKTYNIMQYKATDIDTELTDVIGEIMPHTYHV